MKKLLLFFFVAMMGFSLVSCGSGKTAGGRKHRIGVLAPAVTHGWVAAVAFYAEKRCKELDDQIDYKIYTSSSGDEMTSQLDELIAWNADAIVAFPQWTGMDVPLGRAIKDGVKVLGDGELTKKLNVKAAKFTKAAEEKIVAAGGTVEVVR